MSAFHAAQYKSSAYTEVFASTVLRCEISWCNSACRYNKYLTKQLNQNISKGQLHATYLLVVLKT